MRRWSSITWTPISPDGISSCVLVDQTKLSMAFDAASVRLGFSLLEELTCAIRSDAPACFVDGKLDPPWSWRRIKDVLRDWDYGGALGDFGPDGFVGPDGIALSDAADFYCITETDRGSATLE